MSSKENYFPDEGNVSSVENSNMPLTPEELAQEVYYPQIVDAFEMLDIKDEELRRREDSNYGGEARLLEMYDSTGGADREAIIKGLGVVVENAKKHPDISSRVINLAMVMDLAQLDDSIKKIEALDVVSENENLQHSLHQYKAMRSLLERERE